VPLYNLMEDAATAEISRTQLWQWIRHGAPLEDGRVVTRELFREVLRDELDSIYETLPAEQGLANRLEDAARLFDSLVTDPHLADFLTVPAYAQFLTIASTPKE
jgi:malate synthase